MTNPPRARVRTAQYPNTLCNITRSNSPPPAGRTSPLIRRETQILAGSAFNAEDLVVGAPAIHNPPRQHSQLPIGSINSSIYFIVKGEQLSILSTLAYSILTRSSPTAL
ncbi:unnamed protein product [Cuscuta epithymum]|uniref:Uncharacterized protein n=1 Tax=Cuscuta epithymum TaxID=186058 RepID=A0AAV0FGI2_9ASTE|nr:unnamed protein product [Cuscuta epithymum]